MFTEGDFDLFFNLTINQKMLPTAVEEINVCDVFLGVKRYKNLLMNDI